MALKKYEKLIVYKGVDIVVDTRNAEDADFLFAISKLMDGDLETTEQMTWWTRAMESLFGDGAYAVMKRLKQAHGGHMSLQQYEAFVEKVYEELNVKNS